MDIKIRNEFIYINGKKDNKLKATIYKVTEEKGKTIIELTFDMKENCNCSLVESIYHKPNKTFINKSFNFTTEKTKMNVKNIKINELKLIEGHAIPKYSKWIKRYPKTLKGIDVWEWPFRDSPVIFIRLKSKLNTSIKYK